MKLRVLVDAPGPAAHNMAVDEALLLLAREPVLRLYGWQPHAVSLGWFQRSDDFADLPPGTPVVRRLTGGGAIHHGDELTFALALDAALLPGDVSTSYRLLHEALVRALADCGVASRRSERGAAPAARPSDRWCFATAGRDDLLLGERKLLGSAQRRLQRPHPRVLHHGSLVLQRPSLTPFAAAIADCRPLDAAFRQRLPAAIAARLAEVLDLVPTAGLRSADESALARRLAAARYANAAFLRRR